MAYINASSEANRVKLVIVKTQFDGNGEPVAPVVGDFTDEDVAIVIPGLQDVTLNNANGSFRWKQLDQSGESVITTNATNSLSGNFVLDPSAFFGDSTADALSAAEAGIFKLSNERTQVDFYLAPSGDTAVGDNKVFMGNGFISALAPTVSADSPVWVSPITIEVNGDYTVGTVPVAPPAP